MINKCSSEFAQLTDETEKFWRNSLAEKSINARNHLVYGSIKYIVKCVRSNPRITSPDGIYDTVMDVLSDMAENAFKYNPSKNVKFITYM